MSYYKYTLPGRVVFRMHHIPKSVRFENEWIMLQNGLLYIKKGYSWDGCSPKFMVGEKVLGIWDGPLIEGNKQACEEPSLIHDALYQFLHLLEPLGVTRRMADLEFLTRMDKNKFILRYPYYLAVRLFGWRFV